MKKDDHDMRVLVEKSSTGHSESCKKLYDVLIDPVYAYVRSRTDTNEHATDVTQDIFIDLFSAMKIFTYTTRGQFYSYLFVIVRRKLAQYYEGAKKRSTASQQEFSEESMSGVSHCLLQNKEAVDEVQTALSTLTDTAREIVVLHHWSRYTFGEIALLLKMEESAVRVRHHRALKLLAETLRPN